MRKYLVILSVILSVLFLTSCASQKSWVYKPNDYVWKKTTASKKAVVLPFSDQRENMNKNHIFLYMIPLVPWGSADYHIPEGVQVHLNSGLWINYEPKEDFSKALAEELRSTGLFEEAHFDFRKGDADYTIRGKILKTDYEGKLFSYGLSIYGPLLWLIGLPATTTTNELSVKISCTDNKSEEVLFAKTYTADPISHVSWIYCLHEDFVYSEMLKEVFQEFSNDLRVRLNY